MKKETNQTRIAESKAEEEKKQEKLPKNASGSEIMSYLVAKTFTRHSQLTEEEFLKEIGFEGSGKTEDEALRIAFLNVLTETATQLLQARNTFKMASALLQANLIDKEKTPKSEKGEQK